MPYPDDSPSDFNKIAQLKIDQDRLRDITFFNSVHGISQSSPYGQGRPSNALGNRVGNESWFPIERLISEIEEGTEILTGIFDKLDIQALTTIVDGLVTPIPLKIFQRLTDGKIFSITPKDGKEILLEAGGNIAIAANTLIKDGAEALLQFFCRQ